MSTVHDPQAIEVSSAVADVLVNRRRGRFELAVTEDELILRQGGAEEHIALQTVTGVDTSVVECRVRLRFRTLDGSAWTFRWYDARDCRTALVLDALGGR